MDPVTAIGLVAVAVMFCTGVGLVWLGLRRRPDRLPLGADDVLAAVADGRLSPAARPAPSAPAPRPEAIRARADDSIDLVKPPTDPPRAKQVTPSVRIVPKEAAAEAARPVIAPAPVPAPAPAATAVAEKPEPTGPEPDATREQSTAELNDALFGDIDDPSQDDSGFFADKPQLQRF